MLSRFLIVRISLLVLSGVIWAIDASAHAAGPKILPDIPFVANAGEVDSRVALYAATHDGTLFVGRDGELTYLISAKPEANGSSASDWALKQRLLDALPLAVRGVTPTPIRIRHIRAVTREDFSAVLAQPTYRWADLGEAWRGITVRIQADKGHAEQYFNISPGARVHSIHIELQGAQQLAIGAEGSLKIATERGSLTFSTPVAWQEIDGARHAVAVHYALRGARTYGFTLGRYDSSHAVIIDPLLQATYLGGSGAPDQINAIAIDPHTGDVYAAGQSASRAAFPVSAGALQPTRAGLLDAFVARLPADLKSFTEVTYLGGSGSDAATSIVLNPGSDDVYVAGYSSSTDFPGLSGGAVSAAQAGYPTQGAFVSRFDSSLATLRQSTAYGALLGSSTPDKAQLLLAINVSSGEVYLAGEAGTTGPAAYTPGLIGTTGGAIATFSGLSAGFVARFSADLKSLLQATYLAGSSTSIGGQANASATSVTGIVIEPASGDLLITGTSNCATLPTTGGVFQPTRDPVAAWTGYVARLPKSLVSITALSYLSAGTTNLSADTYLQSVALHPSNGDVYVAGETNGNLLQKTADGYQATIPATAPLVTPAANAQAELIARIAPDLTMLRQATYVYDGQLGYGGYYHPGDNTRNFAIAIASGGDVFTAGLACPGTLGGAQPTNQGSVDLCIARFAPDLRSLVQSTFLGGSGTDSDAALAISPMTGDIYTAGITTSADFPRTAGGAQPALATGATNGFVARLSSDLKGNPQSGSVQLSAAAYSVADTAGNATVTITRIGGSSGAAAVVFATYDGTGKASIDYTTTMQTVTFADGDAAAKSVTIPVRPNTTVAGDETFSVTLSNATGAALGTPASAVLTITQTAAPASGSLQFSSAAYSVADNAGSAAITVTRSGGSHASASVILSTKDGSGKAGTDYTSVTTTVNFAIGDTAAKTINVPVRANTTIAGNETVNLALSQVSGGATLGSPANAVLTITQSVVPVPTPPQSAITVEGRSGGGAIAWLDLVLLALLAGTRGRRRLPVSVREIAFVSIGLTCLLTARDGNAAVEQPHAGASVGQTYTNVNAKGSVRKLDADDIADATVTLDDRGLGGKIFIGAQYNPYFASELAYVDLKSRANS